MLEQNVNIPPAQTHSSSTVSFKQCGLKASTSQTTDASDTVSTTTSSTLISSDAEKGTASCTASMFVDSDSRDSTKSGDSLGAVSNESQDDLPPAPTFLKKSDNKAQKRDLGNLKSSNTDSDKVTKSCVVKLENERDLFSKWDSIGNCRGKFVAKRPPYQKVKPVKKVSVPSIDGQNVKQVEKTMEGSEDETDSALPVIKMKKRHRSYESPTKIKATQNLDNKVSDRWANCASEDIPSGSKGNTNNNNVYDWPNSKPIKQEDLKMSTPCFKLKDCTMAKSAPNKLDDWKMSKASPIKPGKLKLPVSSSQATVTIQSTHTITYSNSPGDGNAHIKLHPPRIQLDLSPHFDDDEDGEWDWDPTVAPRSPDRNSPDLDQRTHRFESRSLCKTIVTTLFYITSYSSFASRPQMDMCCLKLCTLYLF